VAPAAVALEVKMVERQQPLVVDLVIPVALQAVPDRITEQVAAEVLVVSVVVVEILGQELRALVS
tara:strand:- start:363 stop:557 length:195 start_codon:yes stop_codon:yes gene_type:complete